MTYWKPGSSGPGLDLERSTSFDCTSLSSRQNNSLPILHHRDEILYTLQHHQVVLITGETGSGKTR